MSLEIVQIFLATGAGLGYTPGLPGTVGAAAGVVPALGLGRLHRGARIGILIVLVLLAMPVCEYGARAFGGDDRRIVADELLTFPVATAALPVAGRLLLVGAVFLASRALDGIKPPPARYFASFHGGVGIVLDDVVANAWTLLLAAGLWRFLYSRQSVV